MGCNLYLAIRITECALGIVCFGLFTHYGLIFNPSSVYKDRIKEGVDFIAADAFPLLVQLPYLIVRYYHGRKYNHNILNPIMALVGSNVYIAAGAMSINEIRVDCYFDCPPNYVYKQTTAVGIMFTITGCIYMIDLIGWCIYLRKESPDEDVV